MSTLTLTAPSGALCALYAEIPTSWNFGAIDPNSAIPASYITTKEGITTYSYEDLDLGLYHYTAIMEGHYSICQIINHTGNTQINVKPDKMEGNGYEASVLMLCTPDLAEKAFVSHKDAWGSEYAKLFCTPQFLPGRVSPHQQTTNEELKNFIEKLHKTNKNMYIFSLGKSPKYGYDIPLVLFTRESIAGMTLEQAAKIIRNNGKPTVQYCAQCHSSEPASCEGALAMMVSLCGDYGRVLDSVDIYIIPRINPDGAYEAIRHSPTTGEDMNRDYLYMHNAEVRMVTAAYNLFRPEVAIDGHERYLPRTATEDIFADIELQTGAGALNHPAAMTELTMKMALDVFENARKLGLRSHFYAKLASAAGGSAGSSYFGTRNSLSFLIETPGQVRIGGYFMERRVLSQYISASSIIDFTANHRQEILSTVHSSREHMCNCGPIYDQGDVIVLEHGSSETGVWNTPLLNAATGAVTDPSYPVAYKEHTEPLLTRPKATAYVIPAGLPGEDEILRVADNHALEKYRLRAGSIVHLQQYVQTEESIALTEEKAVCFETGAYVFPNIIDSTILGVIMEPDFNPSNPNRKMTLLRMGLITADVNGYLPLYRYCHNLKDGKILENNHVKKA